jgi:hypothetical protein
MFEGLIHLLPHQSGMMPQFFRSVALGTNSEGDHAGHEAHHPCGQSARVAAGGVSSRRNLSLRAAAATCGTRVAIDKAHRIKAKQQQRSLEKQVFDHCFRTNS